MRRNVICYVMNRTGQSFKTDKTKNTKNYVWHGREKQATKDIGAGTGVQTPFYYEKTPASTFGVTGRLFYELDNGTFLQFSFNNPYTQQVPANTQDTYCDCFFYAGIIQVSPTNLPSYYVECVVDFDGNDWSPSYTKEVKTLKATVTIYKY